MNLKKAIAIIILIIGLGMIGGSLYIKDQVAQGKLKVSNAEGKISEGQALFSLNPVSKQIGNGITQSADRKIASANRDISYYANLAQQLMIGGIIFVVIGVVIFAFSRKKK